MGFGSFLFGSNKGKKMRENQYNKVANYDNRMKDFKQLSGSALNSMSNRGIINSSVTSKAMSDALTQAERNYWNDQMNLLNIYDYNSHNSDGALTHILGGIGGGIAGGIGSGIGKGLGSAISSGIKNMF